MNKYKVASPYQTVFGIAINYEELLDTDKERLKRELHLQAKEKLGEIALEKVTIIPIEHVLNYEKRNEYRVFILSEAEMKRLIDDVYIQSQERLYHIVESETELQKVKDELYEQINKLKFVGLPVFTLIGGVIGYVL